MSSLWYKFDPIQTTTVFNINVLGEFCEYVPRQKA